MKTALFRNGVRIRQRGQGMTEYIIITALIAIAAIAAVTYFGSTVRAQVGAMGKERGLIIHLDLEIAFGAIDVSQLLHRFTVSDLLKGGEQGLPIEHDAFRQFEI